MKNFIEVTLTSHDHLLFGGEPSSKIGNKITINPMCIATIEPESFSDYHGTVHTYTTIRFLDGLKKTIEVSEKYEDILKLISDAMSDLYRIDKSHRPPH